ncbi:MAG: hypothetical protein WCJ72_18530, partial [Chryseobacterium sp.]
MNKINKIAKFSEKKRGPGELLPESLSLLLYEFLLRAENCRVVLLTGTPIINYPNEIGILFNILRGYIKTWNFTLVTEYNKTVSKDKLQEIFSKEKVLDYIDYVPSSKTLTVTRNPYGFDNKITASSGYKGVTNEKKEKRNENGEIERDQNGAIIYEERGNISDNEFIKRIVKILKKNDITAETNGTTFNVNTALPDTLDEFINTFIDKDSGRITNIDKFKRRIIGLTSYFRSAQEELLPSYDKNFDRHEVYIPMSDYQFKIYEGYRQTERKSEKPGKKSSGTVDKDGIFNEPSSTYRIFSRLACNFVMPEPPGRPNPDDYRVIMDTKKEDKLLEWMKEKYFTGKREFDADIEQKYIAFKSKIPEENLTKYNSELQDIISLYLKEYFKKNYREPIEVFAKEKGATLVFEKRIENELAVLQKADAKQVNALAKAEAKKKKDREKADRAEEKARQKEAEKIGKAKEKEEKAREKAEAKNKKGGDIDDTDTDTDNDNDTDTDTDNDTDTDTDNDTDNDIGSGFLGGGGEGDSSSNPAENFIDKHEGDEELILEDYKDEDANLREADELESDELLERMGSDEYKNAIKEALRYLKIHSQEFLTPEGLKTYSPKFLAML